MQSLRPDGLGAATWPTWVCVGNDYHWPSSRPLYLQTRVRMGGSSDHHLLSQIGLVSQQKTRARINLMNNKTIKNSIEIAVSCWPDRDRIDGAHQLTAAPRNELVEPLCVRIIRILQLAFSSVSPLWSQTKMYVRLVLSWEFHADLWEPWEI